MALPKSIKKIHHNITWAILVIVPQKVWWIFIFIMDKKELNQAHIHTLVGYYTDSNSIIRLDGGEQSCITYRNLNKEIVKGKLYAFNLKYSIALKEWVIFQAVPLES